MTDIYELSSHKLESEWKKQLTSSYEWQCARITATATETNSKCEQHTLGCCYVSDIHFSFLQSAWTTALGLLQPRITYLHSATCVESSCLLYLCTISFCISKPPRQLATHLFSPTSNNNSQSIISVNMVMPENQIRDCIPTSEASKRMLP